MECTGKQSLATEMIKTLSDDLHRCHTCLTISVLLNIALALTAMTLFFY